MIYVVYYCLGYVFVVDSASTYCQAKGDINGAGVYGTLLKELSRVNLYAVFVLQLKLHSNYNSNSINTRKTQYSPGFMISNPPSLFL